MRPFFNILFSIALICVGSPLLFGQSDFYRQELQNLSDLSRLPLYRSGEIEQLSSYDRTGGNDDGFSGKYSAIRKDPEGLVIADLKGPGVVNRIWTPTPTTDTIRFFFDGEKKPRIAVPFVDLFAGTKPPFVAPLCGNQLGGFYCYLPLPYEKSLRIVYSGTNLRFHQTQFRTLSSADKVRSFSMDLFNAHKSDLERVSVVWSRKQSPLDVYGAKLKNKKVNLLLAAGKTETLFSAATGGRVVGIELGAGSDLVQAYRDIMLTARWDGEPKPALDVPLHDMFGFAFGKPSVQSVLLGSDNRKLYSYLPMPFDRSAEITLRYDKTGPGAAAEIMVSGTVWYTEEKRDAKSEGKFYVQSRREYNIPSAVPHLIAEVKGKGHYVGTILATQGLEDGTTWYFEGDDQTTIDGKLKFHGTGSEDYFNGGYYAVMDKWDQGMSLPIHGSLIYDLMTSRTGGYRFYLSDKMNFNESIKLTIEHQPEAKHNLKTDYTSIAMFYAERPQFENTDIRIDDKVVKVPHRHKLTAQGMVYSLYWLASALYEDPAIVFGLKESDAWFAKIDIEAVPIVQVFLNSLENGRYKVYVDYGKSDPFSIWQRSAKISDWITSVDMPAEGGKTVYAGEIEITDSIKTLTLRKKVAGNASVKIHSLQFERIEP